MISKKDINLLLEGKAIGITITDNKLIDVMLTRPGTLLLYKCLYSDNTVLYLNKSCNFYLYGNEKSEYDIIEIELI